MAAGHTRSSLHRRVDAGHFERVQPRVVVVAGSPRTWQQKVVAACTSTGGVASHRTAAAIWELDRCDTGLVELSIRRGRLPRPHGVVLHRSTDLRDCDVTVHKRIPVTNPLRTILDLGAVAPPWAVESALDRGLSTKLVSLKGLEVILESVGRKGRRGAGVLRRLLAERGGLVPDSVLEGQMHRLCRRYGLPIPRFHYIVRDGQRFLAEVDFAFPELRLAIEVDGYGPHCSPEAFQDDRTRQNKLVAAGWIVLRFTWDDVVRRPEVVANQLLHVLGTLRRA